MADTDIVAIVPRSMSEVNDLAKLIAPSELLPVALRNKPANVAITLMMGSELGIGPMQALRGIDVIQGKATLKPELLAAMVMRRADVCEYLRIVERTDTKCTYETKRKGHPEATRLSFTIEDARKMGLADQANYKKQPADMLDARCLSRICRKVYPDLCFNFYVEGEVVEEPTDDKAAQVSKVAAAIREQAIEGVVVKSEPAVAEAVVSVAAAPNANQTLVEQAKLEIPDAPKVHPVIGWIDRIEACADMPALVALIKEIKTLPVDEQEKLKPLCRARRESFDKKETI